MNENLIILIFSLIFLIFFSYMFVKGLIKKKLESPLFTPRLKEFYAKPSQKLRYTLFIIFYLILILFFSYIIYKIL